MSKISIITATVNDGTRLPSNIMTIMIRSRGLRTVRAIWQSLILARRNTSLIPFSGLMHDEHPWKYGMACKL